MCSDFLGLNNLLESSAFTQKEMTRESGLGEKIMCLRIVFKGEIYRLSSRQLDVKKHDILHEIPGDSSWDLLHCNCVSVDLFKHYYQILGFYV